MVRTRWTAATVICIRGPGFDKVTVNSSSNELQTTTKYSLVNDDRANDLPTRTIEWVLAAVLFVATALVVVWQNAHVAVLWDLSYVLDNSYRIALGQIPYRDFPFAHPPLTFLVQAAIIKLSGRVFWHHVAYCALVGGTGIFLTWRILRRILAGAKHQKSI